MTDSDAHLHRWVPIDGWFHAYEGDGAFLCHLKLLDFDESALIQATEAEPFPPNPCVKCLLVIGMGFVEEESLGHAKARGYERVEPLDD